MYQTLAQKSNLSVREVTNKYRKDNLFAVPFIDKKGETKYRVFYNEVLLTKRTMSLQSTKPSILV